MDFCLIKIFVPLAEEKNIDKILSADPGLENKFISQSDRELAIDILLEKERVKTVANNIKQQLSDLEFQLLVLPVEAIASSKDSNSSQSADSQLNKYIEPEIYTQIAQDIALDNTDIALVILSTVIAAIGLLQNSQVVIIGAMVIAPLLKPNMALAIATTFGDLSLAVRTIKVGLAQITIALCLSIAIGIFIPVNLDINEVAIRTNVEFIDVVLAFASGVAGALSLTEGEQKAVVGVMVSVALLPPLVVLGMLLGSQLWHSALETTVLVSTNIVCLNLAAIATFWIKDIRPQIDWRKFRASKITGIATVFWSIVLAILAIAIFMFEYQNANLAVLINSWLP